ncbi:MAG: DUF6798 domain-containing protein [Pirellulaceae bacterium]
MLVQQTRSESPAPPENSSTKNAATTAGRTFALGWPAGLLLAATSLIFVAHVASRWQQDIAAADLLVVNVDGRFDIDTDRHRDWLAACDWISKHTPRDSMWFTPRYQQTFKWYAGRAEVVCWKDVPQDNASVLEWYRRIQDTSLRRDEYGQLRDWHTQELLELSDRYGFEYILFDRAFQQAPPLLEILYPIETENPSFAICRIRK